VSEASLIGMARPRIIVRSVGAVLAGIVVDVLLTIGTDLVLHRIGVFPPSGQPMINADGILLLATAYRVIYGVAGGYITARLAPDRPMQLALLGGAIGLVVCIVGAVATWNGGPAFGPHWFPLALVATAMPCAWLGGKLRVLQFGERPNDDKELFFHESLNEPN
jgi:peptidoglycan/LPS O-acetylase OafA/YrhL